MFVFSYFISNYRTVDEIRYFEVGYSVKVKKRRLWLAVYKLSGIEPI